NGEAPEDEIAWLSRVVARRRRGTPEKSRAAAWRNVAAALRAGTTLVADITTAGASWGAGASAPLRGVGFAGGVGLKRERALQSSQEAWEWIATVTPEVQVTACARPGLSPHAPYSTTGWLYRRAAESRLPLATHLAEMPEELELLERGTGRLRKFLE